MSLGPDIKHGLADQSTTLTWIDAGGNDVDTVDNTTAGLSLWYRRAGGPVVTITPAALASVDAEHADGGIEPYGVSGMARLDLPDAAVAAGAAWVDVGGSATGAKAITRTHMLVGQDPAALSVAANVTFVNLDADAAVGLASAGLDYFSSGKFNAQVKGIDAGAINASAIAAAALNGKGDWLLASGYTSPDNATLGALNTAFGAFRATYTDLRGGRLDNLDATIQSRMATFAYTAPLDSTATQSAAAAALTAYDPPTHAELTARSLATADYATLANQDTLLSRNTPLDAAGIRTALGVAAANLDTQLGGIVTTQGQHTTTLTSLSGVIVGKLDTLIVDGAYTAAALVNAPTGEGGGGSSPTVDDIATRLLLTPANKLATDASGRVTTSNPAASSGDTNNFTVEITDLQSS